MRLESIVGFCFAYGAFVIAALSRIFEPFFSTKHDKGSGLGLYIVKQLVERNSGRISVKSKLGSGTKFILGFPSE